MAECTFEIAKSTLLSQKDLEIRLYHLTRSDEGPYQLEVHTTGAVEISDALGLTTWSNQWFGTEMNQDDVLMGGKALVSHNRLYTFTLAQACGPIMNFIDDGS